MAGLFVGRPRVRLVGSLVVARLLSGPDPDAEGRHVLPAPLTRPIWPTWELEVDGGPGHRDFLGPGP